MRLSRPAVIVAALLFLGSGAVAVPAAADDPTDPGGSSSPTFPAPPSREQVERARSRVADTARDVSAIQATLVLADQRLHAAAVHAESAAEDYNGALWRLRQARAAYRAATAEAARARRTVAAQRDRIGALAARSYQEAGELSALSAVVGADGPQAVLDRYAAFQGASSSLEADYQRFEANDSLARAFEARAEQARTEQAARAQQARQARSLALAAAESAQAEASTIAAEKDALVRELARAQRVSVSLARTRQAALERIAQQRAAERSRRLAEAHAAQRARTRRAAGSPRADRPPRELSAAAEGSSAGADGRSGDAESVAERSRSRSGDTAGSAPTVRPEPEPVPAPTPASTSGAQRAISFATAQLGEPYEWAAAGPGSWDCSGLTMKAWATAGRSLPHYSVAQYAAGVPISVSDLRPGDLVFWSSNGAPSGIHHVAMYVGGGQIVHAPRTGRPVTLESMYYWVPPDLFARV